MNQLQSFTNCVRRIEVEYGREGWHGDVNDVEPALYAIFRHRDRLRPLKLGISTAIWDKGPPGIVLSGIARILPDYPDLATLFRRADHEWVGLALAVEAWSVQVNKDDDPNYVEATMTLSHHRQIHRHPDRTTIRAVYGIDREQHRVMVVRDEVTDQVQISADEVNWTGTVQEGLVDLVATIDELTENTQRRSE